MGLLGGVGFLTALGAHLVAVGLPSYSREQGLGYLAVGLLLAAYNLAEIAVKPMAGRAADRLGPRPVMFWGTVCFAGSCFVYLALPASALPGIRFCQGLGAGALSVTSVILVAQCFPGRLGTAFGIYHALKGAGYVIAPLFGGLTAGAGMRGSFALAGSAGLAVLSMQVLAWASLGDRGERTRAGGHATGFGAAVRLWPWLMANFFDMALFGVLTGFLPMRAGELGYGAGGIAGVLVPSMTAFLLAQPLAGAWADRAGRRSLVLAGLIVGAIAVGLLGVCSGIALLGMGMAAGAGIGAAWTNSLAQVGAIAHPERVGKDLGLAGSCKDAGDIVGPLCLGYLAGHCGLREAFALCGLAGLASAALLAMATRGEGRGLD